MLKMNRDEDVVDDEAEVVDDVVEDTGNGELVGRGTGTLVGACDGVALGELVGRGTAGDAAGSKQTGAVIFSVA
jgi:hypothetical protein